MPVICDGCGDQFDNASGLAGHQRFCDEYKELEESLDDEEVETVEVDEDDRPQLGDEQPPNTVSTSHAEGDELTEKEAAAMQRDDYECRGCSSDESLQVHALDPSVDRLANLVTVCDDCLEEIEGLNRRTKRTILRR